MTTPLKLPPGISEAQAVAVAVKWRALIWTGAAGRGLDENGRIDLLERTCIGMLGDEKSGKRLASMAVYG